MVLEEQAYSVRADQVRPGQYYKSLSGLDPLAWRRVTESGPYGPVWAIETDRPDRYGMSGVFHRPDDVVHTLGQLAADAEDDAAADGEDA